MKKLAALVVASVLLAASLASADIYMQNPRGSNNRLTPSADAAAALLLTSLGG
jgi:hypothetical protein